MCTTEVCSRCLNPLTESIDLLGGDFLAGFTLRDSINFDEWQRAQSQNLITDIDEGFDDLIQCLKTGEQLKKAIEYAQSWLELDRTNEIAHRHLIDLYIRTGKRGAALNQYRECVDILKEELGVQPEIETVQLYEAFKRPRIRDSQQTDRRGPDHNPNNLPRQLTNFVGRESEVKEIKQILEDYPLLTLTGAGGSGKTRLAVEVAKELSSEFPDGVWFAALAPLF